MTLTRPRSSRATRSGCSAYKRAWIEPGFQPGPDSAKAEQGDFHELPTPGKLARVTHEIDDRLAQRIVGCTDLPDGRGVVVSGEPHRRRRLAFGECQTINQFGAIDVDQWIFKLGPGNKGRDAVSIDMRDRRVIVELR